jgi:hypothetical protein
MSSEERSSSVWRAGAPAAPAVIAALESVYPGLPDAYLAQLREDDSAEGDLAVDPGWIALWPAANVARHNTGYRVNELLPGFLGFGSNGGGELLAFDTRAHPWRICMIPFVPMAESEAVEIAPEFETLTRHFGRTAKAG